jgi:prepilin-type N-terminal cleavage/methylation domain-containing protein
MMRKNKKGFTLVELLAVIGIVGVILGVVLVGSSSARNTARISTTAQQIQLIYGACQSWLGNGRVNYTGISLTNLQNAGYLPSNLVNPWGGTYTVSANSSNSNQVDIQTTQIPSQNIHNEIVSALGNILSGNSYTSSSKTSTFTF